jgi:hypothetical protein
MARKILLGICMCMLIASLIWQADSLLKVIEYKTVSIRLFDIQPNGVKFKTIANQQISKYAAEVNSDFLFKIAKENKAEIILTINPAKSNRDIAFDYWLLINANVSYHCRDLETVNFPYGIKVGRIEYIDNHLDIYSQLDWLSISPLIFLFVVCLGIFLVCSRHILHRFFAKKN